MSRIFMKPISLLALLIACGLVLAVSPVHAVHQCGA